MRNYLYNILELLLTTFPQQIHVEHHARIRNNLVVL